MRSVLAAVVTTLGPTLIGARWVTGPLLLRYALGALIGMVIVAFGAMIGGLANALVPGLLLACLAGWLLGPRLRFVPAGEIQSDRVVRTTTIFVLVVGACLLIMSVFRPIPAWDAWMTWSLKAKALAVDRSFYGPVFTSQVYGYSHQDYPTLLPGWQALAYLLSGALHVSWPLQFQLAWLWTAGAVALINLTARCWGSGFLFIVAWLCAPQVIYWVMGGYADVPMALLLLTGIVVLLQAHSPRSAAAGGILLAGCVLTKNEGLPLATMAILGMFAFSKHRATPIRVLALILAAAAPWLLFTRLHGIPSDLITARNLAPHRVLALLPRIIPIAEAWSLQLLAVRQWGLLIFAAIVAVLYGWRPRLDLLLVLALSFALLTAIYIITPYDLARHLSASIDRVAIAPVGLLALCLASGAVQKPKQPQPGIGPADLSIARRPGAWLGLRGGPEESK